MERAILLEGDNVYEDIIDYWLDDLGLRDKITHAQVRTALYALKRGRLEDGNRQGFRPTHLGRGS